MKNKNKSNTSAPKSNFMRQPVDLTANGECSRCAGCCSSILPVTDQELASMKAYADKIGFKPVIPGGDDIVYMMCPFLQPKTVLTVKHTCAIYDARPEICRAFICNKTNGQIEAEFKARNHGMSPSKSVNVWKAYNLTGLRKDGKDILYDDTDVCILEDDEGRKIEIHVGRPVNITLTDNTYIHGALCIAITDDMMQIANESGIQTVYYDKIHTVTL